MDRLVGDLVIVTLRHPCKAKLRGFFKDAVDGELVLTNVLDLKTQKLFSERRFAADEIVDLFIPARSKSPSDISTPIGEPIQPIGLPARDTNSNPSRRKISVHSPSGHSINGNLRQEQHSISGAGDAVHISLDDPHFQPAVSDTLQAVDKGGRHEGTATQPSALRGSTLHHSAMDEPLGDLQEEYERAQFSQSGRENSELELVIPEAARASLSHNKAELTVRSSQPRKRSSKQRARKEPYHPHSEGWATEDASDIHELGDFDFAGNLDKFNKKEVWDALRADDTAKGNEGLVQYNRMSSGAIPAQGEAGGNGSRDLPAITSNPHIPVGNTARAPSSTHNGPSHPHGDVLHIPDTAGKPSQKPDELLRDLKQKTDTIRYQRPRFTEDREERKDRSSDGKRALPESAYHAASQESVQLQTIEDGSSGCPTVSVAQLLELEHLAKSELGLTEDVLVENAGQAIARAALQAIDSGKASNPTSFLVVMLLGHTRSNARVLAAGRHMINHGLMVIAAMSEPEDDLRSTRAMNHQLDLFSRSGGHVLGPEELTALTERFDRSPGLIIDALLGMHLSCSDLETSVYSTIEELANWALSNSHVQVLAVDYPLDMPKSPCMLDPS